MTRKELLKTAGKKQLQGHKSQVHSLDWNCDGRKLATGSADKTARIWSFERLDSYELKGHEGSVDQLSWDPLNPDRLATTSCDKTVRLWDIRAPRKATANIKTSAENINLCWSPDGKALAVGDKNDLISFIDPRGGSDSNGNNYIFKELKNDMEVNEISWNYAGDLFFLATGTGHVNILEYETLELAYSLPCHTSFCACVAFDPRGRYFASGGADAISSVWDLETLLCVSSFSNLDRPIRALSFSHDGEFLASGSEDSFISVAHIDGDFEYEIDCGVALNALAWHPNKFFLAYAGDETGKRSGDVHIFGYQ